MTVAVSVGDWVVMTDGSSGWQQRVNGTSNEMDDEVDDEEVEYGHFPVKFFVRRDRAR